MASKKKSSGSKKKSGGLKKVSTNGASRVSFKDVQLKFLLDGLDGVTSVLGERKSAKGIIVKAIAGLKDQGHDTSKLESYVEKTFPATARGRSTPEAGEDREYIAQRIGEGSEFLRLPLNPLGVKKGSKLKVSFTDDRIVVVRA